MSGHGQRDHGGGLDAAVARYGGTRSHWLDLSTGINPLPYPVGGLSQDHWASLPDQNALDRIIRAARNFWQVPDSAGVVVASGASALIARIPHLLDGKTVSIPRPTYNEHQAAFDLAKWKTSDHSDALVVVHPNNPDGRLWSYADLGTAPLRIIDESFCDVCPERSHIKHSPERGTLILKSFGKFWGLAGLRLGFAICAPDLAEKLKEDLGPWPVSGPALEIGATALEDESWARATRARLAADRQRLDQLLASAGYPAVGGTDLFGLYSCKSAAKVQEKLARHHIWSRIFPYSENWLRLGLPGTDADWQKLTDALA